MKEKTDYKMNEEEKELLKLIKDNFPFMAENNVNEVFIEEQGFSHDGESDLDFDYYLEIESFAISKGFNIKPLN